MGSLTDKTYLIEVRIAAHKKNAAEYSAITQQVIGTAIKAQGMMNFSFTPPYFSIGSTSDVEIMMETPKISRAEVLKGFRLIKRAADTE